jgi:hypothetical protein
VPAEIPDGLIFTTGYEKTGALYRHWQPASWTTSHGEPGTLEFWLSAGREHGFEWWLPDSSQLHQRVTELRAQHQQAARLPASAVY